MQSILNRFVWTLEEEDDKKFWLNKKVVIKSCILNTWDEWIIITNSIPAPVVNILQTLLHFHFVHMLSWFSELTPPLLCKFRIIITGEKFISPLKFEKWRSSHLEFEKPSCKHPKFHENGHLATLTQKF